MLLKQPAKREAPSEKNGWAFHPTSLETYLRCPRKFYYAEILGLVPKKARVDFDFGAAFHAGVAMFYSVKTLGLEAASKFDPNVQYNVSSVQELAKILAIKAFTTYWASCKIEGSDKKNLETGMQALVKYCETYQNDTAKFEPSLIECTQPISMPNGTILLGTIDRVERKSDDYLIVTDTKTTGSTITDWFWKNFENSFQLSCYYYMIEAICGHCDAVQIDAIKIPWKDDKCFARKSWMLTDLQKEDWMNTYHECTCTIKDSLSQVPEAHTKYFFTNPTSCSDYGGCEYLPICKMGFQHPVVKLEFTREER